MADPLVIPATGSGGTENPQVATDKVGDLYYQLVKLVLGAVGGGTAVDLSTGSGDAGTGTPRVVLARETLTASAPTAATVGVASAEAVAANASRVLLVLVNTSTAWIYLAFGAAAVVGSGIALAPSGGTLVIGKTDGMVTAQVRAIASAAGSNLAIQEFTQ